ncbi:hypothetical protein NBRC3280_3234 [Acetobacter pasteurianus NBRC 3280]|uniref:Uncharacterized protein n=1 Tax=Acetobacter pasteurianus NBRC 3278 TaxID=1226660 RepID=A0A401X8F2_ACEPA|nr:hypothetical protein NBRC3277_3195 [Acetobacter pasteurianus NBRC 3277]GCD64191.1 hypothetical protein NBRC3278_3284 [Acetobacter pasteurianus NBRC 3278]GCD70599.1 hypothetical protein NBRC3280_3234 [Acetobacter pasteurianus NBRC 3280]
MKTKHMMRDFRAVLRKNNAKHTAEIVLAAKTSIHEQAG